MTDNHHIYTDSTGFSYEVILSKVNPDNKTQHEVQELTVSPPLHPSAVRANLSPSSSRSLNPIPNLRPTPSTPNSRAPSYPVRITSSRQSVAPFPPLSELSRKSSRSIPALRGTTASQPQSSARRKRARRFRRRSGWWSSRTCRSFTIRLRTDRLE